MFPGVRRKPDIGDRAQKARTWGDGAKAIKAAHAFLDAREADGKPWTSKESPGGAGIHQKQRGIAPASHGVETGGLQG
jgi:hypothetical protein